MDQVTKICLFEGEEQKESWPAVPPGQSYVLSDKTIVKLSVGTIKCLIALKHFWQSAELTVTIPLIVSKYRARNKRFLSAKFI
jgi:hypothetical protein